MRSLEEYRWVLELDAQGFNRSQIARHTGINRRTVIEWVTGRGPRAYLAADRGHASCAACGHPEHDFAALDGARYAYLLGMYLGDGYVASLRRTPCLRIFMDARHPCIIGECVRAVRVLMPGNRAVAFRRKPTNCVVIQCYSKQWPCLLPQHGSGRKHERPIVLAAWQRAITERFAEPFIRGLIHSDGCRSINRVSVAGRSYRYVRYQFTNVSQDIRLIFCDHLDLLEIEWRPMNARNVSVARRASVARLDEFVGPKR